MNTTNWQVSLDDRQVETILTALKSQHSIPNEAVVSDAVFARFVADEICKVAEVKNQYNRLKRAWIHEFGIGNKGGHMSGSFEGWLTINFRQRDKSYGAHGGPEKEHRFSLTYSGTVQIGSGVSNWFAAQKTNDVSDT